MKIRLPLERLQALNARERRLATILGSILGALLFVVLPLFLLFVLHERRSDADELRASLDAVQSARSQVRERKERKDAVVARYAGKAPALAGFLEQAARSQKLEVTDSVDRPEVPHGKRYVERNTVIHLKKAGMGPLARFIESLEASGKAIAVTRLNIRKRSGEPDSYDVEIGVSAYDRNDALPATPIAPAPGTAAGAGEEKKP